MQEIQRDIGKHDAQIEALDKDLREMREDMRRIFEKLDSINTTLAEAKGGWQVLMVMGGVGAAFGSVIGWAIEHFSGK